MKAPIHAYVTDDEGSFLKLTIQRDSTPYSHFVARYLKGSAAEGGYSPVPQQMKNAVMTLFHLDHLADVFLRVSPTEVRLVGFVGLVLQGGGNEQYHDIAVRGSGLREFKEGGGTYLYLNDAGLNTRPDVGISDLKSTFANVIVIDVSVSSSVYQPTDSAAWELLSTDGQQLMRYNLSAPPARTTRGYRVGYWDASLNSSPQITDGQMLSIVLSATNEEGTTSRNTYLTTKPRVLWEALQGRPEWHRSESQPTTVSQMMAAPIASVDLYEADLDKLDYLPGSPSGVAAQAPAFYDGPERDWPTMSAPAAAGWYYSPMLPQYTKINAWGLRAIYVDDTGLAKYYTAITDAKTLLIIGIRMRNSATEPDRPNNTYRTIELYCSVSGGWYEGYPSIRVRVGVYGAAGSIPVSGDATVITDMDGNTVPHTTNVSGLNINTVLTDSNKSYSNTFTNVYSSQALMNQYGGEIYYDTGKGVYYNLDQNPEHWSVVCLDADGAEHPFEGNIKWFGGAVAAETTENQPTN